MTKQVSATMAAKRWQKAFMALHNAGERIQRAKNNERGRK